jgi:hypothetical protein
MTPNAARSKLLTDFKRWTAEAKKTMGRAELAKRGLRTIKAELKKARRSSKIAKKAAKQARKKLETILAGLKRLDAATAQAKGARAKKAGSPAKTTKSAKDAAALPKPKARAKAKSPQAAPKPAAKTHQTAAAVARSVIKRLVSDKPTKDKAATVSPAPSPGTLARSAEPVAEPTDNTAESA